MRGRTTDVHIEVEDVVAKYGDLVAIKQAAFEVHRGGHLTLLGPSGRGKTTMLRCVAGLETPVSGGIRVDGKPFYSSRRKINLPSEERQPSLETAAASLVHGRARGPMTGDEADVAIRTA